MILHVKILKDEETDLYYSEVLELPGVFSQGKSVEECMENSKEAITLALEDEKDRERFGITGESVMIEYIIEGETINVG
ncbi:MAG: type II toxin-antitoxin system HicB family antitoxin [Thermotogae bacterium]|nr:type II toxin-antitoxin system HicB family antitoxin [Thermotogota bacterium]